MIKQAELIDLQTVGCTPVGVCAREAHLIWELLVTAGPQPPLCLFVQTAVTRDPRDSRLGGIRTIGWQPQVEGETAKADSQKTLWSHATKSESGEMSQQTTAFLARKTFWDPPEVLVFHQSKMFLFNC